MHEILELEKSFSQIHPEFMLNTTYVSDDITTNYD